MIVADVSSVRSHIVHAMLLTLLCALLAGGVGVAAAVRLQRRITGPIGSLIGAMTHIREARDYSTKVEHKSDDETGALVDAFNGMMGEISYRDEALRRLAYFDPLTGLANRQEFQRHLEAVLARARQGTGSGAALALVDLDEFKSVNDAFGHSAGDGLLMDVSARFKAECLENMHLARLGGDEFGLIVQGSGSEAEAQQSLAPFLASLLRPIDVFGRPLFISASAGVVLIPRDGVSTADLLRRADLALYSAKREGKARISFYHERQEVDAQALLALAQDLRVAAGRGELEVHYQPQLDTRTGAIAGFESLLRWKHPEHGYISPAKFIPIAENNGIICDLGQWVLRQSCRQVRSWIDQGLEVGQVSVNVSVAQLRQAGFEAEVRRVLTDTGLPSRTLCLELTESLFAGHSLKRTKGVLESLKAAGVQLAIDDFGTGYSSLSYLQGFPFDKLKVDRAFVRGAGSDAGKRKLLRGMIDLAHALNLSVVAEGAETAEELAAVAELGAELVQGYAVARPLPAAAAAAFLRSANEVVELRA
jgi:diguanylate cyclase (GGDEF)-like protein